jgi:hypothetical protein
MTAWWELEDEEIRNKLDKSLRSIKHKYYNVKLKYLHYNIYVFMV